MRQRDVYVVLGFQSLSIQVGNQKKTLQNMTEL